jgi:hypothetical protein
MKDTVAGHTTYDHRSVKIGHSFRDPPFSPSFMVIGSQRVIAYALWEPDV